MAWPLEREASGTGSLVFVPAILDRLCRLTSMQIGTLGAHPAVSLIVLLQSVVFYCLREASGIGRLVFVPAILDRLCRLTAMQIGTSGAHPAFSLTVLLKSVVFIVSRV